MTLFNHLYLVIKEQCNPAFFRIERIITYLFIIPRVGIYGNVFTGRWKLFIGGRKIQSDDE